MQFVVRRSTTHVCQWHDPSLLQLHMGNGSLPEGGCLTHWYQVQPQTLQYKITPQEGIHNLLPRQHLQTPSSYMAYIMVYLILWFTNIYMHHKSFSQYHTLTQGGRGFSTKTRLQHDDPTVASFPGFPAPEREDVHAWRAWYLFSRDQDIIKIGHEFLKQKVTFCALFNLLCVQHSVCMIFAPLPPIARYVQ